MSTFAWTILLSTIAFTVAILGMAVGVVVSNRRLRGSCGGLAGLRDADGQTVCDLCSHPSPECTGEPTGDAEVAEGSAVAAPTVDTRTSLS